jgi:hypothetical protein
MVGWLAMWLGSRLGSWARLALVSTLLVPVVVKPQIKSFEGGERHVAMVRILASLEMGMAQIPAGSTLCLAVGTYTQGAGDSHA